MVKFLGVADLIGGFLFLANFYHLKVPWTMMVFFIIYLVVKGIIFLPEITSLIDIIAGISLLVVLFFPLPDIVLIVFAVFLALKGLVSLFS